MDELGAIVAAAIAALVSVVVTLVTKKRGDAIRAEEQERADAIRTADQTRADADRAEDRRWADQIREADRAHAEKDRSDDREQAAKDTRVALEHQAASMKEASDFERAKQHEQEGRATARNLLARLRVIRDGFESQTPNMWGYTMKRPDRNTVEDASLVIPDTSLRGFVLNTMEAIDHLQYAVERATYKVESVPATQRTLLLDLMREVGAYAAANKWRDEKAQTADEIADAIDRAYQDVLAEEEWERKQQED